MAQDIGRDGSKRMLGGASCKPLFFRRRCEFEAERLWDEADIPEHFVRFLVECPGLRFDIGNAETLRFADSVENQRSADALSTEPWIDRNLVDLPPLPRRTKRVVGATIDEDQNVTDGMTVLFGYPSADRGRLEKRSIPSCQF